MDRFWARVQGRLTVTERSQAWLARRMGVSRAALNLWFHGREPTPPARRQQVADMLGIRVPENDEPVTFEYPNGLRYELEPCLGCPRAHVRLVVQGRSALYHPAGSPGAGVNLGLSDDYFRGLGDKLEGYTVQTQAAPALIAGDVARP